MHESHLTDFSQAMAWAEAEPEPAQAYDHSLGFSFGRQRPQKAKLYRQLSGQAEPAQHYPLAEIGTERMMAWANSAWEVLYPSYHCRRRFEKSEECDVSQGTQRHITNMLEFSRTSCWWPVPWLTNQIVQLFNQSNCKFLIIDQSDCSFSNLITLLYSR